MQNTFNDARNSKGNIKKENEIIYLAARFAECEDSS